MPDREKVIKGLQCIIDGTIRCESCGYAIDKHGHHSCHQKCVKDAIALLKEQEAVKPTWGRGKPYCGTCGSKIRGGKYCSECGKPILWGGR